MRITYLIHCVTLLMCAGCATPRHSGNELAKLNEANTRSTEFTKGIRKDSKQIVRFSNAVDDSFRHIHNLSELIEYKAVRALERLK